MRSHCYRKQFNRLSIQPSLPVDHFSFTASVYSYPNTLAVRLPIHINNHVHFDHRHLRPAGHCLRCSRSDREASRCRDLWQHRMSISIFSLKTNQSISLNEHCSLTQSYSASQVSAAVSQGCDYFQAGNQVGSNNYPHRYNNYEGFDFRSSGPWQEFPITRSGVYTGGKSLTNRTLTVVEEHYPQYGNGRERS